MCELWVMLVVVHIHVLKIFPQGQVLQPERVVPACLHGITRVSRVLHVDLLVRMRVNGWLCGSRSFLITLILMSGVFIMASTVLILISIVSMIFSVVSAIALFIPTFSIVSVWEVGVVIAGTSLSVIIILVISVRLAVVPVFSPSSPTVPQVASLEVPVASFTITVVTFTPRKGSGFTSFDHRQGFFYGKLFLCLMGMLLGRGDNFWLKEGGVASITDDDGIILVDITEGGLERS